MLHVRLGLAFRIIFVAVGLSFGPPSYAFVRTPSPDGRPVRWRAPLIRLSVDLVPKNFGLTSRDVGAAVARAARVWSKSSVPCTAIDFRVSKPPIVRGAALDGINSIAVLTKAWCSSDPHEVKCYNPNALALTKVRSRGEDGTIIEADIELNAVYYRWRLPDGRVSSGHPSTEVRDLQELFTHELGHVLGLSDSCSVSGEVSMHDATSVIPDCRKLQPSQRSSMFPVNEVSAKSMPALGHDERRFLCEVYPKMRRPR